MPKDMRRIEGREFAMGSADFYPEERPVHRVSVDGFWMDEHPVTVAEFRRFVKAISHVTVAEHAPDPADFPDVDPDRLVPGSLIFRNPPGPVPLDDVRRWWHWVPGADWRHPYGPGSTLDGLAVIRSRTSPTTTLRPKRPGPASRSRQRRDGSSRGARRPRRRRVRVGRRPSPDGGGRWPTGGRAASRGRTSASTARKVRRR
jgi:hypothetical protein